ncbi:MAG: hypothetical protein JST92_14000 [Deltaproteobacteria bacterium]|nr:hypothetical protein [Deltaproteobacteria bacterium]
MIKRFASLAAVTCLSLAFAAHAQSRRVQPLDHGQDDREDIPPAKAAELGFHLSIAPGVYLPSDGSPAGFSLSASGRYGLDLGRWVISPGASLQLDLSDPSLLAVVPTVRVTFPIGIFGPFVQGGLGFAHVFGDFPASSPMYQAGGGFVFALQRWHLGLEVMYATAPDVGYSAWLIAPIIAY